MKTIRDTHPSPWLQLLLAVSAILPWWVLVTSAVPSKNPAPPQPLSYQTSHKLAYDLNYQAGSR